VKKVTQYDIAKYLNICQGTVSKILTGYDQDTFPEETRKKVIAAAKQFNYVHPSLIIPKRRDSERKSINADATCKIVMLGDSSVFGEYRARVSNVGQSGLVVGEMEGDRRFFPIDPFRFEISVHGSMLDGVNVRGVPVRIERTEEGKLGFAVEFTEISEDDKVRIREYLDTLPEISSKRKWSGGRKPKPVPESPA